MPQVPPALTRQEVDKRIELWHNDTTLDAGLHDYLGWSWEEYETWVLHDELPRRKNA